MTGTLHADQRILYLLWFLLLPPSEILPVFLNSLRSNLL